LAGKRACLRLSGSVNHETGKFQQSFVRNMQNGQMCWGFPFFSCKKAVFGKRQCGNAETDLPDNWRENGNMNVGMGQSANLGIFSQFNQNGKNRLTPILSSARIKSH
jgi:hypothetical protein